jgi:hypothetical protein
MAAMRRRPASLSRSLSARSASFHTAPNSCRVCWCITCPASLGRRPPRLDSNRLRPRSSSSEAISLLTAAWLMKSVSAAAFMLPPVITAWKASSWRNVGLRASVRMAT